VLDSPRDWNAKPIPSPTAAAAALRPEFSYAPTPPRTETGRPLLTGTAQELLDDLGELEHAGVEHLLVRFWTTASDLDADGVVDQMERFAEEVAPRA
jgi:hypothetical protein